MSLLPRTLVRPSIRAEVRNSRAIKPMSAGLFQFYAENTAELTLIAAAIVITASPLILLFLFTQRYIVAGLTGGALKG